MRNGNFILTCIVYQKYAPSDISGIKMSQGVASYVLHMMPSCVITYLQTLYINNSLLHRRIHRSVFSVRM